MATRKKTGGRRKGTPNTATAERQAQVAASGKTPLEVMLDNMRRAYNEAQRLMAVLYGPDAPQGEEALALMEEMWRFREAAQRYAMAAAPYVHPRLAAVQGEEALALMEEMWRFREAAQRYAMAAAPYVHPRLAAVSHQHRGADGSIVRPILVIEGYPADLDGPLKAISAPEEEDGGGNGRH
jgi:hypothetical protein